MKHIQLDLETLGLRPGSVVLSIGAVQFDFENEPGEAGGMAEFHCDLRIQDQVKAGLAIDPDTLLWWMQQEDDARNQIIEGQQGDAPPVYMALAAFSEWLEGVCGQDFEDGLDLCVWANGANFDQPILREVYRHFGITCPWAWYYERCHRTAKYQYRDMLRRASIIPVEPEQVGTLHNARDDAMYQARLLTFLQRQLAGLKPDPATDPSKTEAEDKAAAAD